MNQTVTKYHTGSCTPAKTTVTSQALRIRRCLLVASPFRSGNRTLCSAGDGAAVALVLSDDERRYYREVAAGAAAAFDGAAPSDFFELLGIEPSSDVAAVKDAYRRLQRLCHPDICGDAATGLSALLNIAYVTLSDADAGAVYAAEVKRFRKEVGTFDGRPVSIWCGTSDESRAVFVDETTCIGCQNCTWCAPKTFHMEDEWGRARVASQWADDEEAIKEAVATCPVDCIYYVSRKQLALLEFVMKSCKREDTALMARRRCGNMSTAPSGENPFEKAVWFLKRRQNAKLEAGLSTGSIKRLQDEILAAAIAKAWLELPEDVRVKGWPHWQTMIR
eukprot:jgi/Chrzof1/5432/Cz16g02230.t1